MQTGSPCASTWSTTASRRPPNPYNPSPVPSPNPNHPNPIPNRNPNPNPNPHQAAAAAEDTAEVETRDRHSLVSLALPNDVDEEDERHLRDEQ
eukprot:scaffold99594_cov39-Phaeocystis_antarctica.AAC.1